MRSCTVQGCADRRVNPEGPATRSKMPSASWKNLAFGSAATAPAAPLGGRAQPARASRARQTAAVALRRMEG